MKILAITDETPICECCGKSDLKRVVVIELDNGSVVRYGRDCAAKMLGKKVGKDIDFLAEITAYVTKWASAKPENMERAIWNKFGMTAKFQDGRYQIHGLGTV
jgi:hypothetical protein